MSTDTKQESTHSRTGLSGDEPALNFRGKPPIRTIANIPGAPTIGRLQWIRHRGRAIDRYPAQRRCHGIGHATGRENRTPCCSRPRAGTQTRRAPSGGPKRRRLSFRVITPGMPSAAVDGRGRWPALDPASRDGWTPRPPGRRGPSTIHGRTRSLPGHPSSPVGGDLPLRGASNAPYGRCAPGPARPRAVDISSPEQAGRGDGPSAVRSHSARCR